MSDFVNFVLRRCPRDDDARSSLRRHLHSSAFFYDSGFLELMIMNRFSVVRFNNKFDRGGDVTLCSGCERCERGERGALLQISKSHSRATSKAMEGLSISHTH